MALRETDADFNSRTLGAHASFAPQGDSLRYFRESLAETEGFEPSVPLTGYDDLANRCLQPLGHVSGRRRG